MNKPMVKMTYRNERQEPVYERTYTLKEYTEMLRADLLRLITDVEDTIYELSDGRPKEKWSDEAWGAFCKIKHKLLDKAGDIGRLCECLYYENEDETLAAKLRNVLMKPKNG